MSGEFSAELTCGMGIHTGQSIVGMMGYGEAISRTAIGDNVNVASRLEQMTKNYNSELVNFKLVADNAGLDLGRFKLESVEMNHWTYCLFLKHRRLILTELNFK